MTGPSAPRRGDLAGGAAAAVFRGVGVALVTMFTADGAVDPGPTSKLASELVARGMRAVLVCGTTGEAATLSEEERAVLVREVRAALPAEVPVLAGTGAPSARQAATLTTSAVRAGAGTSRSVALVVIAQVPSVPTRAFATSKPRSGSRCSRE